MCGLSLHTNKAHIIRSVLEAICYRTKDVIDAMEKDSNIKIHDLKVDGGPLIYKLIANLINFDRNF